VVPVFIRSFSEREHGRFAHSECELMARFMCDDLPYELRFTCSNNSGSISSSVLVAVTITDRGPFVRGRIIDVTPAAARELGFSGLTQVVVNLAWE
jgi:hypothetical protein